LPVTDFGRTLDSLSFGTTFAPSSLNSLIRDSHQPIQAEEKTLFLSSVAKDTARHCLSEDCMKE
jgi:hypothetical protein